MTWKTAAEKDSMKAQANICILNVKSSQQWVCRSLEFGMWCSEDC
jgi:hypothetical protein